MSKNIFDYKHVKSVSCCVLIDKQSKEIAGKIVANWSDNPAGSVCTAQVILHDAEKYGFKQKKYTFSTPAITLENLSKPLIGKAGGYGYDKLSSAIASAFCHNCDELPARADFNGAGLSAVKTYFDKLGIELHELI